MSVYLDNLKHKLKKLDDEYITTRSNLTTSIEQQIQYEVDAKINPKLYARCECCYKLVLVEMAYKIAHDIRANYLKTKTYCGINCHYYDQYDISL
jgi:hypothetical protein